MPAKNEQPLHKIINFELEGQNFECAWVTENEIAAPNEILVVDDSLTADSFVRSAALGAAFVWVGDFHNAKQLLQAVQRRILKKISHETKYETKKNGAQKFYQHRQLQAYRAQNLSRLLICIDPDLTIPLRRAPDFCQALSEALRAVPHAKFVMSLSELLGINGAHQWRKNGVYVSQLDRKIHPHYGVFSPIRSEYLDLILSAPLPAPLSRAFDIGTGTGVIAAILAQRGVQNIIATDLDDRALECATENLFRLGFNHHVSVVKADLFPDGTADLIVCNPPWLPAKPTSSIECAVYDEASKMLKGFLKNLSHHLTDTGEAWLILSDLAELLDLRAKGDLQSWIKESGLYSVGVLETRPRHSKSMDRDDPLFEARSKETTRLWRLKKT